MTRTKTPSADARIKDVMVRALHTVATDNTFDHAHALMHAHELHHLPVMRDGKLVGVISQRDLHFVESLAAVDTTLEAIADATAADVFTVDPDDAIHDAIRRMAEHRLGCAVVVDRGRVVGLFTATDALRLLAPKPG
jgi:acetoin utilization protein AcuB